MKLHHHKPERSHLERVGWLVLFFIAICWATVEFFLFLSGQETEAAPVCRNIAHVVVQCTSPGTMGRSSRENGSLYGPQTDKLDTTLILLLPKRG